MPLSFARRGVRGEVGEGLGVRYKKPAPGIRGRIYFASFQNIALLNAILIGSAKAGR